MPFVERSTVFLDQDARLVEELLRLAQIDESLG